MLHFSGALKSHLLRGGGLAVRLDLISPFAKILTGG